MIHTEPLYALASTYEGGNVHAFALQNAFW